MANFEKHAPATSHMSIDDPRARTRTDPTSLHVPSPSVEALKGRWLVEDVTLIKCLADSPMNPMARAALSESTREFHLRALHKLRLFILNNFEACKDAPLAKCIIDSLQADAASFKARKKSRKNKVRKAKKNGVALPEVKQEEAGAETAWTPGTHLRHMLNVTGAFSVLSAYSDFPVGISLRGSAELSATTRYLIQQAAMHAPTMQPALTVDMVLQAWELETKLVLRQALTVMLFSCCRVGDALKLRKKNITLEGNNVAFQFTEGKGVLMRGTNGPYTVHSCLAGPMGEEFKEYLKTLGPEDLLVPASTGVSLRGRAAAINVALKRISTCFTTRSLRRGALQALATGRTNDGQRVGLATVMGYAGHRREETTMRYLDWKRLFGDAADKGQAAAELLAPGRKAEEQAAAAGLLALRL